MPLANSVGSLERDRNGYDRIRLEVVQNDDRHPIAVSSRVNGSAEALEAHDGGLEIHSNFGEGSQIAIWLPLTDTSQEQRI